MIPEPDKLVEYERMILGVWEDENSLMWLDFKNEGGKKLVTFYSNCHF